MKATNDALLDSLFTAVLIVNEQNTIDYANAAAEQLLCLSARKIKEHSLPSLFQLCSIPLEKKISCLALGQSITITDIEFVIEGKVNFIEIHASQIRWQSATVTLLEIRTINQQRQLTHEAQQQAQQEASKQLIRGLAHEIKNPLGGLRGAAQLLQKQLPAPEFQDYTDIIISQADRLKNLVDRLLGPQTFGQKKPHNIHAVLENIRQLISLEAPNITIIRDYDPSLPELVMDHEQIEQAILNVANNALFAITTAAHPRLTFRTRTEHQIVLNGIRQRLAARIDVIDNGVGIPADQVETIFYPMISGRPEGTGLGLSITRNLIHQHQGKVTVSSTPGHTVFTFLLPIYPEETP